MLSAYATGIAAVVALTLVWVGVQGAWRKVFPGPDPDALAGRGGCRGCRCTEPCEGASSSEEGS